MIVAEETYLTPDDIARRLKVNEETVLRWLRSKQLIGYKVSPKLWRVSLTNLNKFLEDRRPDGAEEKQ